MTDHNIGAHRLVVGAHYGLRDWMAQRVTAVIMAIYTLVLLANVLTANDFSYHGWSGLFAPTWMKVLTFVALLSVFYHAWVGVRDILMDYVKPLALRLVMQVVSIVWLLGCAGYAVHILWRA
jgi:succinate dehydrogenase / fumarate reductase, membrane anchor subunit